MKLGFVCIDVDVGVTFLFVKIYTSNLCFGSAGSSSLHKFLTCFVLIPDYVPVLL